MAAVLAGIPAWVLKSLAMQPLPGPRGDLKARPRHVHGWRLAAAHLFGVEERPTEKEAAATRAPPITWALSAVLAMRDPSQGSAILGKQGKMLKVLQAGAALDAVPGGRLLQVFADHVALDLQGRTETVSLPKSSQARPAANRCAWRAVASPAMGAATAVDAVIRSLRPELAAFNGRGHQAAHRQRL
jgi:hypothetical protein